MALCERAQQEFELFSKGRIVSLTQLYGGKIVAALSRQHPRDLFDFKYMDISSFNDIKQGVIFNILSSEKPVIELLSPNEIDQKDALENQFRGMTDIPFTYNEYEQTRQKLIKWVNSNLTERDKAFLIGFEEGGPLWDDYEYDFSAYPSVHWKSLNIRNLKKSNPLKHKQGIEKLEKYLISIPKG